MKNITSWLSVAVVVAILLSVGYLAIGKKDVPEQSADQPDSAFHTVGFPFETRFFNNQLIVLTSDKRVGYYDLASQKVTPIDFPGDLFDTIYHFSFAPAKDRAFVVGSKLAGDKDVVRYAVIDLERYTITWFEESVVIAAFDQNYYIDSFVLDTTGTNFLFTLTTPRTEDYSPQEYHLAVVDPKEGKVVPQRTITGQNVSLKYYSSRDNTIAYNTELDGREIGVLGNTMEPSERVISHIESLTVFPNDVVVGGYAADNSLAFASVSAPDTARLTVSPEGEYTLVSPTVARSVNGTHTAYHLWKPESREGIVRVIKTGQEIVYEQPVQGSVEMFFSADDKQMMLVNERTAPDGMLERQGYLVDLRSFQSTTIGLPESVDSIIAWY